MIVAIHQPQYLPWVPYFDKIDSCDQFIYLDNVQYQKNGLQNRNQIKTATGAAWLTVPVNASLSRTIGETTIAESAWREKHWRTLEMNYTRARYWPDAKEALRNLYTSDWDSLAALNIAVTDWMCGALEIATPRVAASSLSSTGKSEELVLNLCREVGADVYLSGTGAAGYQQPESFRAQGITLRYQQYANQPYSQCHTKAGFVADLSALDLILNEGPNSRAILLAGRKPAIEPPQEDVKTPFAEEAVR